MAVTKYKATPGPGGTLYSPIKPAGGWNSGSNNSEADAGSMAGWRPAAVGTGPKNVNSHRIGSYVGARTPVGIVGSTNSNNVS